MTARGWEILLAVAVARFGWFLLRATVLPKKSCRWCKGTGKNPWSNAERSGPCWFCGGEPWRPTRGARAIRRIFRRDQWGK